MSRQEAQCMTIWWIIIIKAKTWNNVSSAPGDLQFPHVSNLGGILNQLRVIYYNYHCSGSKRHLVGAVREHALSDTACCNPSPASRRVQTDWFWGRPLGLPPSQLKAIIPSILTSKQSIKPSKALSLSVCVLIRASISLPSVFPHVCLSLSHSVIYVLSLLSPPSPTHLSLYCTTKVSMEPNLISPF